MQDSGTKTAVITAVLTGIFTVLAALATYWFTTKEPALTYTVTGGPVLASALGTKRIFVVDVRNSGKKEIAQTLIQLALKGGELGEISAEATAGVRLTEEKKLQQVDIQADLLNPGDSVKVAFLASLPSPDLEPRVTVRAPGVQGISETKSRDEFLSLNGSKGTLLLLLPPIAAVLISVLLASFAKTRVGARVIGKIIIPSSSINQSEISAYVCGACGLIDEASALRFGGGKITYRGAADYLRHRALASQSSQHRKKFETALRAFLLSDTISFVSADSIRWAVSALATSPMSDIEFDELRRNAVHEGKDPALWRERIDAFVEKHLSSPVQA